MGKAFIDENCNKIINGGSIDYETAVKFSQVKDKEYLYESANKIRRYFKGNKFDLYSITNAKSGKCSENCKWCAQSGHYNTNIETYDLIDPDEALAQAKKNDVKGIHRYSLVTSGRQFSDHKLDQLVEVYKKIRTETNLDMCASMGLLKREQLKKLKSIGLRHYHCNLETAPSFYAEVCNTISIDEKIETIKIAKEEGLEICSGGIIGMGESMEHRIELAFELNKLDVQSIPVNILTPVEGTPMAGTQPLTDEEVLTTFALFRFINPRANIRFAGGRMQIKHIQEKALKTGINAALVGDLLTTIGSDVDEDKKTFTKMGYDIEREQDVKQES